MREAGYDLVAITEVARGADDATVLRVAHEEHRILLTFDRDFGELIFRKGAPPPAGVVLFRFAPRAPNVVARLVRSLEEDFAVPLGGYFTIVSDERDKPVRQPPMPGSQPDA